eukprot:GHVT01050268.1.p1 GENE.GHVT01050268.1~~GHVT01050268.1.p1  ORF type:complete len:153 (-),score=20.40 GHVT01050268.1:356-814(-)
MLIARELQRVLTREAEEGSSLLRRIFVVTLDGGLIAFSNSLSDQSASEAKGTADANGCVKDQVDKEQEFDDHESLQSLAAVMVSSYSDYASFSSSFETLLFDCTKGRAVVGALHHGALLLAIWGTAHAPYGLLQNKFEKLYSRLSEVLSDLY